MPPPTGSLPHPAPDAARWPASFDPGAALAALDAMTACRPTLETAPAWDAAWIACVTNSPRWAETARLEFARVTAAAGIGRASAP